MSCSKVFTYHAADASVSCCMRFGLIALSSILEGVISKACVEVRAVASFEVGDIEVAAETVSAIRIRKARSSSAK